MSNEAITESLCVRDLIQCVQAARDGARSDSLFAMQCDAVLNRVEQVFPGMLLRRYICPTAAQPDRFNKPA